MEEERPEAWGWHLLGLVNPGIVFAGNLVGGIWVAAGVVYMLGLGPFLDMIFGKAARPKPPRKSGLPFEVLLYVHAFVQFAVLGSLLYRASIDGSSWTMWVAAISTGISSGVSGIIVAHELGHTKPKSFSWWVGRLNLLSVLYLHFTTEHNFTHHKHVSTEADPATARYGESIWGFFLRTVPGQFFDAKSVHDRKGRTGFSNPVSRDFFLEMALVAGMFFFAGQWVTIAFLLQAGFAIFLLEYINYIRHYGLRREIGEKQTEMHSWQSEQRWSRWTLLELTRHPAHHLKASDPFWELQPYENAPTLPSGYYGCFWIALIPPLWRRLVDPRIPKEFIPN